MACVNSWSLILAAWIPYRIRHSAHNGCGDDEPGAAGNLTRQQNQLKRRSAFVPCAGAPSGTIAPTPVDHAAGLRQ
jgi:hypothetical protein